MNQTNRRIRVIIVDDHLMARRGLHVLLEEMEEMELIGEAADGAVALRLLEEVHPREAKRTHYKHLTVA